MNTCASHTNYFRPLDLDFLTVEVGSWERLDRKLSLTFVAAVM